MALHDDELAVDDDLVRRLVRRDHPRVADLPLRRLSASGSSNALFRLGPDLLVRLPRQPGGSASIEKEARWLPALAPALPVAVPDVLAVGEPGFGYPECWSLTRWIDGRAPATPEPPGPGADRLAHELAAFVLALQQVEVSPQARDDPRLQWYRGAPLADLDDEVHRYLLECRGLPDLDLDLDACEQVWSEAVALPPSAVPPECWLHADLLAENLLLRSHRLGAVIDFGALTIGDPCVDLVVAWDVLPAGARRILRSDLEVDDATWLRARAWALAIALMTFPYYWRTMPARCAARLRMARTVLDEHRRAG